MTTIMGLSNMISYVSLGISIAGIFISGVAIGISWSNSRRNRR